VDTSELDYDLPDERIAQLPVEPRDSARLLVDHGSGVEHRHVRDLPGLLDPGDVVVVNTTRVLPARLQLVKETGGRAEVLLLEERDDLGEDCWEALVRPGRRLPTGTVLRPAADPAQLTLVVGDDLGDGRRCVQVTTDAGDARAAIRRTGAVPLPPYIAAPLSDAERYQTIYSDPDRDESVAAPTAGLHLTTALMDALTGRGVAIATVELIVGLGTFRPIGVDQVEDHEMHAERYRVPDDTLAACHAAHDRGKQVVAVGTTTVRALESAAATGHIDGRTDLFIREPYEFQLVDRLLTNFHLPRSSLLAMIDAFVGPDADGSRRWRHLYELALADDYRFLSFGDAMLLTRRAAEAR
jgi:S-adenosylmethionine:tRNA ribosyltransferase-isomerase